MLKSNHTVVILQTVVWGFILYLVSVVLQTTDFELAAFATGVPLAVAIAGALVIKELQDLKVLAFYIPLLVLSSGIYWLVGFVLTYLTGSTLIGYTLAVPVISYPIQIPGRIWLNRYYPEILRSLW